MKQVFARIWKDIKAYGLIVGIIAALWAACNLFFGTACVFVLLTGLPCPGCGIGHALLSLLTGHVVQAHMYNPSIWVWLSFGVSFFLYRYVFYRDRLVSEDGIERRTPGRPYKYMWWFLAGVAIVSVAIYLYRMVNLFPTEPPLTYYEGNLFERMFPMYRTIVMRVFGME